MPNGFGILKKTLKEKVLDSLKLTTTLLYKRNYFKVMYVSLMHLFLLKVSNMLIMLC